MILDATAGNRTMYETKNVDSIIYIDIQKQLARKPTMFADCTRTPFRNKTFHTIFFDPPYFITTGKFFWINPDIRVRNKNEKPRKQTPTYYGTNIYKNRSQLIKFIYNAQKEFLRILRDDGLLWLKWNDYETPLHNILAIFKNWQILLKLYINDPYKTTEGGKTYWICLCKKRGYQTELTSF
jgi:hypothetical protein